MMWYGPSNTCSLYSLQVEVGMELEIGAQLLLQCV